jgi:16S rRNA (guanine527-N7)-methyltransferase
MTVQHSPSAHLNSLLIEAGLDPLDIEIGAKFESYLALILRWNARINLTSIRDEEGIPTRHFVESIACARALPSGISSLLDFGSGAGFPGIPIALCRPELEVTLAESQGKKAAFLQEAVRVVGIPARVHLGRAELLQSRFDCVVLRAVDRMHEAAGAGAKLVAGEGWLGLVTSSNELEGLKGAIGSEFEWKSETRLSGAHSTLLALARRSSPSAPEPADIFIECSTWNNSGCLSPKREVFHVEHAVDIPKKKSDSKQEGPKKLSPGI